MPSKSTFALIALLAATSVSALPRGYGYTDLYARDGPTGAGASTVPDPTANPSGSGSGLQQPPLANAAAASPGTGGAPHLHRPHPHRSHTLDTASDGSVQAPHHHHHNHPLSGASSTEHHHQHQHQRQHPHVHELHRSHTLPPSGLGGASSGGASSSAAPSPNGLSRREYYEELATREVLERRGILETLGLKARVRDLTPKQNEKIKAAQTECDGLTTKKDKHTCHYNVDKIIQLSKERNHYVDEFLKETGKHDVFMDSDPHAVPASSSSSSSSTPSSHTQSRLAY